MHENDKINWQTISSLIGPLEKFSPGRQLTDARGGGGVVEVKETQSAHPKAISAILEISDFCLILFGFRITGAKAELSL